MMSNRDPETFITRTLNFENEDIHNLDEDKLEQLSYQVEKETNSSARLDLDQLDEETSLALHDETYNDLTLAQKKDIKTFSRRSLTRKAKKALALSATTALAFATLGADEKANSQEAVAMSASSPQLTGQKAMQLAQQIFEQGLVKNADDPEATRILTLNGLQGWAIGKYNRCQDMRQGTGEITINVNDKNMRNVTVRVERKSNFGWYNMNQFDGPDYIPANCDLLGKRQQRLRLITLDKKRRLVPLPGKQATRKLPYFGASDVLSLKKEQRTDSITLRTSRKLSRTALKKGALYVEYDEQIIRRSDQLYDSPAKDKHNHNFNSYYGAVFGPIRTTKPVKKSVNRPFTNTTGPYWR
jgi:hypothetical protein